MAGGLSMRSGGKAHKPGKLYLSLFFYSWGNYSSERVSDLHRLTQLVREKVQISTDACVLCHPFQSMLLEISINNSWSLLMVRLRSQHHRLFCSAVNFIIIHLHCGNVPKENILSPLLSNLLHPSFMVISYWPRGAIQDLELWCSSSLSLHVSTLPPSLIHAAFCKWQNLTLKSWICGLIFPHPSPLSSPPDIVLAQVFRLLQ